MILKELLQGCDFINNSFPSDRDIAGVAYDSRKVKEGHLFVAIKGERYDGHDFIPEAIKKGAIAVVGERDLRDVDIYIHVKDSRRTLACIAHNFYGKPSENLVLIGVTGTNGKTTTTHILKSILESWGKEVGLIGTIHYMIKDTAYPAPFTTPESLEFHGLLKDMISAGCTHVISEVSSHALEQRRVDGAVFKVAAFTNLTRDHLDFHKTMENYFRAKERLFRELLDKDGTCVINMDDPYGKRMTSELGSASGGQDLELRRILTYGLEDGADIIAREINPSAGGLKFKISFRGRSYDVSSPIMGLPNVYNIMSAAGVSISLGVPWQIILEGIRKTGSVTGRFEKVDLGQNFLCLIDYAHTEDALERLICAARELLKKSLVNSQIPPHPPLLKGGMGGLSTLNSELRTLNSSPRIITVFGCGGDRDRGKRPKMGAVATRLSDLVILTSDNPRSEEPSDIIQEIEEGVVRRNYIKEPDRREAIRKAVNLACDRDIILIAGKGHEDYQEIKGTRYRFNDREILEEAIKDKLRTQGENEHCGCSGMRLKEF
jgi:UDP-N-acetylmuramoyl-L-alanyl-D-glutamate--2,6-diaminopimelate ligase